MTYDTTKDPRIIVAQRACDVLHLCLKQKSGFPVKTSRETLSKLISACDSAVKTIMYMYQEPKVLASSESLIQLSEAAEEIAHAYANLLDNQDDQSMLRANLRWCLRTLQGLKQRLGNPGISLASGIDLVVVKVRNITRRNNLSVAMVMDGIFNYTMVTNLKDIESNGLHAAAFLPPREMGGTVSEAMFLGGYNYEEPPGTSLNEQEVDAKEAASILYEDCSRRGK